MYIRINNYNNLNNNLKNDLTYYIKHLKIVRVDIHIYMQLQENSHVPQCFSTCGILSYIAKTYWSYVLRCNSCWERLKLHGLINLLPSYHLLLTCMGINHTRNSNSSPRLFFLVTIFQTIRARVARVLHVRTHRSNNHARRLPRSVFSPPTRKKNNGYVFNFRKLQPTICPFFSKLKCKTLYFCDKFCKDIIIWMLNSNLVGEQGM